MGQFQRIKARAHINIDEVQPDGRVADADLAGAGWGNFNFVKDKLVCFAGLMDADCLYGGAHFGGSFMVVVGIFIIVRHHSDILINMGIKTNG